MAETWTAYVRRVLDRHGLSNRAQRARTGIPHSTVNGWSHGIPPSIGSVIAFARGFGEDVDEALEIAGHEPLPAPRLANDETARLLADVNAQRQEARRGRLGIPRISDGEAEPDPEPTPAERMGPAMLEIAHSLGYEGPVTLRRWGGRDEMTHADVDAILADLEADLRAEMEERQRRG